jgi:hypothetical protein
MVTVITRLSTTSKIWDTFIVGKFEINNQRLNKVKINNVKTTRDLGVIIEDEFRIGIKLVLDL